LARAARVVPPPPPPPPESYVSEIWRSVPCDFTRSWQRPRWEVIEVYAAAERSPRGAGSGLSSAWAWGPPQVGLSRWWCDSVTTWSFSIEGWCGGVRAVGGGPAFLCLTAVLPGGGGWGGEAACIRRPDESWRLCKPVSRRRTWL
jgi:hypothetical protein